MILISKKIKKEKILGSLVKGSFKDFLLQKNLIRPTSQLVIIF